MNPAEARTHRGPRPSRSGAWARRTSAPPCILNLRPASTPPQSASPSAWSPCRRGRSAASSLGGPAASPVSGQLTLYPTW